MTERVLGPTGSRRRRRTLLAPIFVIALVGLFVIAGAQAVNQTGAFELDGNATNDPATAGDDWDNVCHEVLGAGCSTANDTSGATAVSWLAEPDPSASIFTGGGSKDPQDPQDSWLWKDEGGLPDKDNLLHGFAARYSLAPNAATCPSGGFATCEVIFFGSDRFANDGDAVQGFWFFQNKIELTNISSQGGSKFSGHHLNNDLLVISDFSNGGAVSTIVVHKWDTSCTKAANNDPQPTQCSAANLRLLASSTAANCATASATAGFCGIVNTGATNVTSPWPFLDKDGSTSFRTGEFFEGGVNLSTLGLGGLCFSSVASETRSSTSPTATLKDFVLDNFGECTATLSTSVSNAGPVPPGTAVFDTLTVTSSQSTVTATGNVAWFLCGPIASGACTSGGTQLNPNNVPLSSLSGSGGTATATSPNVNTGAGLSPGRYCFRAEWPGDTNFTAGPYAEFGGANGTNECFTVQDTSAISTTQNWLPNDSASVTTGSGAAASGTVTFTLYPSANCTGIPITSFADRPVVGGNASTNNTTTYVVTTPGATISWRATFTPSDPTAVTGSTSHCETSTVTINNDIGS